MFYTPESETMVTFRHLLQLASELSHSDNALIETIETLAMWDVPLTPAVIQLGIIGGVLEPDYKSGWSKNI